MSQLPQQFDAARFFDEGLASRYDEGIRLSCPAYDALHQMLAPWFRLLPRDSAFLSAGAGTGEEIVSLAGQFPGWRFIGVDVSADMLAACERRLAQAAITNPVRLHHGRLEEFRAPAPCDAASSIFVVNYIHGREEKLAYLRGIAANLKPGGILVLADLFGDRSSPDFVRLLEAWLMMYISKGVRGDSLSGVVAQIFQNIAFSPEHEVLALLDEAGFTGAVRFFQAFLYGGWVATKAA